MFNAQPTGTVISRRERERERERERMVLEKEERGRGERGSEGGGQGNLVGVKHKRRTWKVKRPSTCCTKQVGTQTEGQTIQQSSGVMKHEKFALQSKLHVYLSSAYSKTWPSEHSWFPWARFSAHAGCISLERKSPDWVLSKSPRTLIGCWVSQLPPVCWQAGGCPDSPWLDKTTME